MEKQREKEIRRRRRRGRRRGRRSVVILVSPSTNNTPPGSLVAIVSCMYSGCIQVVFRNYSDQEPFRSGTAWWVVVFGVVFVCRTFSGNLFDSPSFPLPATTQVPLRNTPGEPLTSPLPSPLPQCGDT